MRILHPYKLFITHQPTSLYTEVRVNAFDIFAWISLIFHYICGHTFPHMPTHRPVGHRPLSSNPLMKGLITPVLYASFHSFHPWCWKCWNLNTMCKENRPHQVKPKWLLLQVSVSSGLYTSFSSDEVAVWLIGIPKIGYVRHMSLPPLPSSASDSPLGGTPQQWAKGRRLDQRTV